MNCALCQKEILDSESRYVIPEQADTTVTGTFHINCGLKEDLLEDGLHLGEKLPFTFNLLAEIIADYRDDWDECDVRIVGIVEAGVAKLQTELALLQAELEKEAIN